MRSSLCRGALALLVALSVVAGSLAPRLSAPALAFDAALTSCDWPTFEARLADVQADGGGVLVLDCAGPIVFGATQTITTDVTLLGNGETALDGGEARLLFEVEEAGRLTLIDLTVQNAFTDEFGGAIRNFGTLEVRSTTFRDNRARWGGAIINYSTGTLTVIESTFVNNEAAADGGALHNSGTIAVYDSIFSDNRAHTGSTLGLGGAIFSANAVVFPTQVIVGSTFTENEASRGGAIAQGTGVMQIESSSFSLNSAGSGGAIELYEESTLNIVSSSFNANSASSPGGAIYAGGLSSFAVIGSEFNDNSSQGDGGAVACYGTACHILASSFDGNEGEDGGAVYNGISGTLDIEDSYFHDNHARSDGGAAYTFDVLTVEGSTFDDNTSAERGGALFSGDLLQVRRSTFHANGSVEGGALYHLAVNTEIYDSTFSGNSATTGSAIVHFANDLRIANTIIVDGVGGDHCMVAATADVIANGPNLVDDDSCGVDGDEQAEANLGPLTDNGGPTPTMMPIAPSDVIDAGSCLAAFDLDQRTAPRPDTGCDIGAVETGAVPRIRRYAMVPNGLITEGEPLELAVTAFGRDNGDLVLRYDCDAFGGPDTEIPCVFPEEGDYFIGVVVCAGADDSDCGGLGVNLTVHNALPELAVTSSPAAQGVTLTAQASDPGGANDPLTYSFDCNGDGLFEVAGASNQTVCPLAPSQATASFTVLVADDDGGVAFERVVVNQAAALCGNRTTGALAAPLANGSCPSGTLALSLPAPSPITLCVNPYTGALIWSPRGTCGAGYRVHVVPDDGPLNYCQNIYTGKLRYTATGVCTTGERAGVIPG